jgi:hypothetical protein
VGVGVGGYRPSKLEVCSEDKADKKSPSLQVKPIVVNAGEFGIYRGTACVYHRVRLVSQD